MSVRQASNPGKNQINGPAVRKADNLLDLNDSDVADTSAWSDWIDQNKTSFFELHTKALESARER